MNNFRKRLGKRSGNVMIEFAIGSVVLMSCFSWSFRYGYTFYRYNALVAAVNAGARYASLAPYDSLTPTPSSQFATAVKNVVVYGNAAGSGSPVVSGLTTSQVSLTVAFTTSAAGTQVPDKMTVKITNFSVPAIFSTISFTNKPKITYKYQGFYSPGAGGA